MPQAVQVETQAKQQGLPPWHGQAVPGSASRELAFDRREHALDQSATPVESRRECPAHFGAHPVDAPIFLPALGGNDALRSELLTDISMDPLAVELRVGQHQA